MIIVNGIDIIEIKRIEKVASKYKSRFLNRIYTEHEIEYCKSRAPQLATRFAAKEAVMKALGTGVRGLKWKDIEISSSKGRAPKINLKDNALNIAKKQNIENLSVSLSHSQEYAIASVVGIKKHSN
jgi:holo-[acyl-carrier protein] synthase